MVRPISCAIAIFALLLALAIVTQQPSCAAAPAAPVIIVGKDLAQCPNAQFSTIQDAVNAATPGSIIRVCPGTYPEQVTIAKPLSIRGDNGVIIQPSNVVANSTSARTGVPVAAIVVVQDAVNVDIDDVIVDGVNNAITQCAPDFFGIFYRNASGTVSHAAVRNIKLGAGLTGCQSGLAIFVQSGGGGSSVVQIQDSSVHDYQKNGITANELGTQVQIARNVVTGLGATNDIAQNGIQIGFDAAGSVTGNTVANHVYSLCVSTQSCSFTADDILVVQSDSITVEHNVAGVSQTGIAISANNSQVLSNRVFDTLVFDGIELTGNGNSALHNQITHSDEAGIFVDGNNNIVTQNQINEADFGILKTSTSTGNVIANNSFFNTDVKVQDPSRSASKASPYR